MKKRHRSGRTPKFAGLLLAFSAAATALFIISGYGYQWEFWSLGTAFTILSSSAYTAFGLIFLNLAGLFLVYWRGYKKGYFLILTGLVLTTGVYGTAKYWQYRGETYPPIHDITTDLENPPEFRAVVPLRRDAPNPPEYAGEETAAMQRDAYPDLATRYYERTFDDVFETSVGLVGSRSWELVYADRVTGLIEATETLPWFGFKDDVVIRFDTIDDRTLVDMRSKSRIGRGDLGVNARRIHSFLDELEERL